MLTPEDRALDIVDSPDWDNTQGLHGTPINYAILRFQIASAIRATENAALERAAQICKELTDRRVAEMGLTEEGAAHLTGYQCVAAIRALIT